MNKKQLRFRREEEYIRYCANERARMKERMKAIYDESKLEGVCYRGCGNKLTINLKTGKLYHACAECRRNEEKRQKVIRDRNKLRIPESL